MVAITGHRMEYNGVGGSERPTAHTHQKLIKVSTQVKPTSESTRATFHGGKRILTPVRMLSFYSSPSVLVREWDKEKVEGGGRRASILITHARQYILNQIANISVVPENCCTVHD